MIDRMIDEFLAVGSMLIANMLIGLTTVVQFKVVYLNYKNEELSNSIVSYEE